MFFKRSRNPDLQPTLPLGDTWGCATLPEEIDFQEVARRALEYACGVLPIKRLVTLQWKTYPVSAGRAFLHEYRICLSRTLLITEQRIRDTVLHEYAHLVVFDKYGHKALPHGPEWREVMRKFDLQPKATHDYDCARTGRPKPYLCKCQSCGYELARTRPLKRNRIYNHIGCGGRFRQVRIPK